MQLSLPLQDKFIVLGVTGSIAAYKSAHLVRELMRRGAKVQVVMTPAAKEFIAPLTLATLSQAPVVSEFFDRRDGSWHSHVALGLAADLMLIAPASAATLGKMVSGVADNMLVTTYLSMKAPTWVAPAMDLDMYRHPSTQANIKRLQEIGVRIIEPESGFLASGLEGKGRMVEPEKIADWVESYFASRRQLSPFHGKRVLITAGPTHEPIDDVRFIGNHSSGQMGFALAAVLAEEGAQVKLVVGPVSLSPPQGVKVVQVQTAMEMYEAAKQNFTESDIAIFAAAVADFRPARRLEGKIKREQAEENISLSLVRNPDIARELGATKQEKQLTIGFALETTHDEKEAQHKMQSKHFDAIVLNSLDNVGSCFGSPCNQVSLFSKKGNTQTFPLKSKQEVARDILSFVAQEFLTA